MVDLHGQPSGPMTQIGGKFPFDSDIVEKGCSTTNSEMMLLELTLLWNPPTISISSDVSVSRVL